MVMTLAVVMAARASNCAGSMRSMALPPPLATVAALPRMSKASPRDNFLSVSSMSLPTSCRIRAVSWWS
jgi:hypothetical protein